MSVIKKPEETGHPRFLRHIESARVRTAVVVRTQRETDAAGPVLRDRDAVEVRLGVPVRLPEAVPGRVQHLAVLGVAVELGRAAEPEGRGEAPAAEGEGVPVHLAGRVVARVGVAVDLIAVLVEDGEAAAVAHLVGARGAADGLEAAPAPDGLDGLLRGDGGREGEGGEEEFDGVGHRGVV